MAGRLIRARNVQVGDTIKNEWSGRVMTVLEVETRWLNRRRNILIHCLRDDNRQETLVGSYWRGKTWLVQRSTNISKP